jgi:LruC domain-containing protein
MFDEDEYKKLVEKDSPVDSVQVGHTFSLATVRTYQVTANINVGAKRVYILSANPVDGDDVEIMAQADIADGEQRQLTADVPTMLSGLYAALLDSLGTYTVIGFRATAEEVDFSGGLLAKQKPLTTIDKLQTFTYLFEEDLPEAGDYDYNDVVLRISLEPISKRQIDIQVELSAVGGEKKLAGAIRLVDYQKADIDSITTDNGDTFNMGGPNYDQHVPKSIPTIWDNMDHLQSGRNGEAVINLFEDAHWATGDNLSVEYDVFTRKKYNVTKTSYEDAEIIQTRQVTYHVYFKEGTDLSKFTVNSLDPFIIEDYNGGIWEVHCFEHRMAQTLYEYRLVEMNTLPWALMIPYSAFRYPLDGVNIGYSKEGANSGAYLLDKHSFGEWVRNMNACNDWYLYPMNNRVF